MALESVSLKGDDESFMADDLEDGEILDEEDDVIPNISTASVAEGDDKKVSLEGSSNSQNVSSSLSISSDKEKTQNDDSKVSSVGTNEKGIRRDSNECVDMHSDDDARRKKKKKKKRHRESDEEERLKDSKRQKRSHHRKRDEENGERVVPKHAKADGEDDDDDEEMMFVRGASPSHGRSSHTNSSSHSHRRERKHSRERHRSSPLLQTPSEYSANYGETSPLHSSRSSHHTNTHRRSRSPHNRSFRKVSRSPTAGHDGGQYDDHYESYDSDYERDGNHYRRGVGRGEEAGTRRGVEDRRKRRGRGVVAEGGSRGSSRGVGPGKRVRKEKRGGGRGETTKTRRPERSGSICMFYMQGKCQKGDDCPYSHDAVPPRKLELCKFYLMDCCAKKDKCLYMHKDFPCKYYHTGMKCFSGEKCKFSHGPLNECLKAILLKHCKTTTQENVLTYKSLSSRSAQHLETAPKEILGDFPRLTREGAAAMVLQQSGELEERSSNNQPGESSGGGHGRKGSNGHKIPSLFEIDIPMPDDVENGEGKGKDERSRRSGEALLEEDDHVEMGEMTKGGKGDDGIREREERTGGIGKRHSHSIHRGSSTEDDRDEKIGHRHIHSRKGEDERRQRRKREEEENRRIMEERREEAEEDLDDRDGLCGIGGGDGGGKLSIVCEEEEDEKDDEDEEEEEEEEEDIIKNASSENIVSEKEMDFQDEETSLKKERGESGADLSDPVNIPLHLPKKQRELFMRIQQQQREAESSQEHSGENEDEDEEGEKEENWYSSDEEAEDRSLTDVLKNLSKQPPSQADKSELTSSTTGKLENGSNSSESKFSLSEKVLKALSLGDLSQISITPDISKLLSTIREKTSTPTGSQSPRVSSSDSDSRPTVRDPRRVGPRDPRQQRSAPPEPPRDPRTKPVILSPRPQTTPSITYAAGPLLSDHGDVDLRQLPEGDVDLRRGPGISVVSSKRDTDLRGRQFGDTDLRRMPPGGEMASLPFRPVPPPEPATEIDASINSHPPITFRLIPVSPRDNTSNQESLYMQLPRGLLPTPDNMGQVQNDPRMRKVLRLDEEPDESLPTNTVASAVTSTPVPIGSPTATVVSTPAVPRVDPRRARPNNPPSPPKPVIPVKDPRTNHQNMGDMTATNTFTPDPRRASRNTVNAETPIINHPPITPAPHGIFHPNINSANMMPGGQVIDNMGMVPMNVNSMCGAEMPPHMSMVGEDMGPGGMNRSVGVRGALLMDPIPEYEEYDDEEERMMMYQDGYGGMGAGGGVGRCNNMMMEQMPRRGFFRGRRSRGRGNWDGGRGSVGGHRGRGDRGSWRDSMGGKGRSGRRGHALPL